MLPAAAALLTVLTGLTAGTVAAANVGSSGQRGDGRKRRANSEETSRRRKKKTGRRSITPSREEEDKVELFNVRQHFCKKFNVYNFEGTHKFENLKDFSIGSIEHLTQKAIDMFIMKYLRTSKSKEKFDDVTFSLQLNHPTLKDLRKQAIYLPPRTKYQNNAFALYALLDRVMQSNETIKLDNQMTLMVTVRPNNQGGACNADVNSFARPAQKDNYCLPRAIARGFTLAQIENIKQAWKSDHGNYNFHNSEGYKKLKKQFEQLKKNAEKAKKEGVRLCMTFLQKYKDNEMMGIPQIREMDQSMQSICRIFVYDDQTGHTIFSSLSSDTSKPILKLLYSEIEEHYELLVTPRGFFNGVNRPSMNYHCEYCGIFSPEKRLHQHCIHTCINCQQQGKCNFDIKTALSCRTCKITFGNQKCFDAHLFKGKCIAQRYKCLDCDKLFYCRPVPQKFHKCHQTHWCGKCEDFRDSTHQCTWDDLSEERRMNIESGLKRFKYIFYDFETSICTVDENGEIVMRDKQLVTHAVVRKVCNLCCPTRLLPTNVETKGNTGTTPCHQCKESVKTFGPLPGDDEKSVLNRFCEWMFLERNNHFYKAIAHNGGKFDAHFLLTWLLENNVNPKVVMNGQNIMSMKTSRPRKDKEDNGMDPMTMEPVRHKFPMINTITCLDSINFIPLALSKFAATFDLEEGKSEFPFYCNTPYWEGRTEWPDAKFYGADQKSEKDRNAIVQFVEQMKREGKQFHLQTEIMDYCIRDVNVLLEGCMKYRKIFVETSKIDPFDQCITLASACMLTFRLNHHDAKRYPIAHLPENGYNQNQVQSRVAEKMIKWLEHERQFTIQHKGNGGEKEVILSSGRKVRFDGFYIDCNSRKKVIDVQGDIWHGCTVCYPQRDFVNPMNGKTMDQLLQETNQRVAEIESDGYVVEQIWECEIRAMLRSNNKMKTFFDNLDIVGRLSARSAFMGGRTQTFKMLSEVGENEEIRYWDICSLYPSVNCNTPYPIGEPEVICPKNLSEVCSADGKTLKKKGLYYVTVEAPKQLAIALLPIKYKDMLMYTLCFTCMKEAVASGKNQGRRECTHTSKERCFRQTYYHEELQYAMTEGNYVIKECHEVWSWTKWTEGAENGKIAKEGLFTSYMRTFFRMKQEASGFPPECETEEQKVKFMRDYEKENGVALRREKLDAPSPGFRYCSKIQLNALWGKFGQKLDRLSLSFCRTKEDVDKIWFNSKIDITRDQLMGDNVWMFAHKPKQEVMHSVSYGSLAISLITTASARLVMARLLNALGYERLIYLDTDSIIHRIRKGDPVVEEFEKKYFGSNLGQLTDEVPKGWRITKVVAPGCKQYGYIMKNAAGEERECCKLRGLTQNFSTKELATVENLEKQTRALIDGIQEETEPLLFKSVQIKKNMGNVSNAEMLKEYMARNAKGQILECGTVLPYGY